ncbi:kinesin-like protein KIF2A [Watersipora subatra]|uniref:kinesin-like protein KIF2A n=1 Tax=Watersipora subatra TaxID=2589382 RepID=UPI00355B5CE3
MPIAIPSQLAIGLSVDIQRSDGRVHSAVISGVSEQSSSVTVEWFEHNETKGKELDIEAVLRLNPHLQQQSTKEAAPRLKGGTRKRPKSIAEPVPTPATGGRVPSGINRKSYIPAGRPASSHSVRKETAEEIHAPPTVKKDIPAKKVNSRKSNVVKEIEKIQEQRVQRRAAASNNAAAYSGVDKSHPHWQFLDMIEEYRDSLEFNPLRMDDVIEDHQICVCVRKRPLNKKEVTRRDVDVATIPTRQNVIIHEPKHKVDLTKFLENQKFRFDYAFDENADNQMVYRYTAQPLVQCIFEGGMATCFAYGQTGSGKTHTMGGEFVSKGQQNCEKGIYALAARDVFKLTQTKYKSKNLLVSVSFFEIYSGKVFDLLNNKLKLRILEDGKNQVQVVGLKEESVSNSEDVLKLLNHGTQVRTSGQTSANQHSSRSHAIFQLILRKNVRNQPLHGKFSLIDLAGNERGADTSSADRQTRMEGAEINKSLLALKECIRALGRKGAHLPFRASKLTLVLRDSFIRENARTCMISTISPGNLSCEHTLNTLRYADRVKELGTEGSSEPSKIFDDSAFAGGSVQSPHNSDLALLKTTNEEEVSDDRLNFFEVITHMQELEEEIIEDYKSASEQWQSEDKKLLKTTDRVDYDVESFSGHLSEMLDARIKQLTSLRNKVASFREDLANEESISKKFNKK